MLSKIVFNETQDVSHFLGKASRGDQIFIRLFNPVTLQYAYALDKVQEVLWAKKSSMDQVGRLQNRSNRVQYSGLVARTLVNFNKKSSFLQAKYFTFAQFFYFWSTTIQEINKEQDERR